MTGYTVHTGSSEKFSVGWDNVFSESKARKKRSIVKSRKLATAKGKKKTASKSAKKKKKR